MFSNRSDFFSPSFFESLEDRVLFDGVPDATFILPQPEAAEAVPAQVQNVHQADVEGPKELILIDAGVQNNEALLEEVVQNRPDSAFEVRMIYGNENGVAQISKLLESAEGKYDAIHIISHGDEGQVHLGNMSLTADNLHRYANDLAGWSDALTDDADLLFYGCDLAGNKAGEQFIQSISAITGADVAASDDLTGAADKGGDWDLELSVGEVKTTALAATSYAGVLAAPVAVADGPIAVEGSVPTNIDVLANDSDADGDAMTVTAIIDIHNGGAVLPFAGAGSTVTLSSGTVVELLADATLNVTTTPLGFGTETFGYELSANGETAQATVTLDRSQGLLVDVPTMVMDLINSTNLDVSGNIDALLQGVGGSQRDILGTEAGYRAAGTGATPTTFTIPEGTHSIRITGYGGENGSLGTADEFDEDINSTSIVVNLLEGTYSGRNFYELTPGDVDIFAFADVPLGDSSTSDPNLTGISFGNMGTPLNDITVDVTGNTLAITDTQAFTDQAFLVEYLTADGSSANLLGTDSAFLDRGNAAANTTATLADPNPGGTDFAVFVIGDGGGSNNFRNEDIGFSRLVVDLNTGLASGTVFLTDGSGAARNAAYWFSDYDITSGVSVLNSGATIVGDSSTLTNNANILNDFTISHEGANFLI